MQTFLIVLSIILICAGILGCFLPVIPGPILTLIALYIMLFFSDYVFSLPWIIVFSILVILLGVLDYVLPVALTKRCGGSKYGFWGAALGMVAGLFFMPLGILLFPLVGTFLALLIEKKSFNKALKVSGITFIGFMSSIGLKLFVCCCMAAYFVYQVFMG